MSKSQNTNTIEIRQGAATSLNDNNEPYIDHLATILKNSSNDLFQARKIGVVLSVPEPVRDALVSKYGGTANDWLAKLDGRVWL